MANFQTGTLVRVVPHRRQANAQRDGYAYPQLVGRIGRVAECLETTLNVAFSDQTAPNMQRAALVLATEEDFWNELRTSMTRLNELHEMIRNRDAMQQPTQPMCERCGLHPTCGWSVSYNGSWPPTHLCRPCYDAETQPQQPQPFTGQGNRLGE